MILATHTRYRDIRYTTKPLLTTEAFGYGRWKTTEASDRELDGWEGAR